MHEIAKYDQKVRFLVPNNSHREVYNLANLLLPEATISPLIFPGQELSPIACCSSFLKQPRRKGPWSAHCKAFCGQLI